MNVLIADEIAQATHLTEDEIRGELAIALFQKDKLTLAQASKLAGTDRISFQHLLASRQIPVHYGVTDFDSDVKTLRETEGI